MSINIPLAEKYAGQEPKDYFKNYLEKKDKFFKNLPEEQIKIEKMPHSEKKMAISHIHASNIQKCLMTNAYIINKMLKYISIHPEKSEKIMKDIKLFGPLGFGWDSHLSKSKELLEDMFLSLLKLKNEKRGDWIKDVSSLFKEQNDHSNTAKGFSKFAQFCYNYGYGYDLYLLFDNFTDELKDVQKNQWGYELGALFDHFKSSKKNKSEVKDQINFTTKNNDNFLFVAVRKANKEQIEKLMSIGAELTVKNLSKQEALQPNLKSKDAVNEARSERFRIYLEKLQIAQAVPAIKTRSMTKTL